MEKERITITQKEVARYEVLRRVLDGVISLKEAATYMGVSYRHAKRLKKQAEEGIAGLAHKSRGSKPHNRLNEDTRKKILELDRSKYSKFNDTHFAEMLIKEEIQVSRESVRTIRREAGISPKRKHKARKHHKRRPRKTCEGLMMLWDGSPHRWFGNDVEACCLMAAIDDATGKMLAALFCKQECSWAYLSLLKNVVTTHGIPASIYQDKHTALKRNDSWWSLEEELGGKQEPTQVGMAMEALGINPIYANSPQAKGRVEKLFETLQDRLVALMSLRDIKDIESANTYLENEFIAEFNTRFSVQPQDEHKWRRLHSSADIDKICSFLYKTTVANDNAIRFCKMIFDIPPGPGNSSYAGKKVDLRQLLDGSWRIYAENKLIASAESTEVGEPFRSKRRHKSAKAAYECEWTYLASRQQTIESDKPARRPTTKITRQPGKPIGATRIA